MGGKRIFTQSAQRPLIPKHIPSRRAPVRCEQLGNPARRVATVFNLGEDMLWLVIGERFAADLAKTSTHGARGSAVRGSRTLKPRHDSNRRLAQTAVALDFHSFHCRAAPKCTCFAAVGQSSSAAILAGDSLGAPLRCRNDDKNDLPFWLRRSTTGAARYSRLPSQNTSIAMPKGVGLVRVRYPKTPKDTFDRCIRRLVGKIFEKFFSAIVR